MGLHSENMEALGLACLGFYIVPSTVPTTEIIQQMVAPIVVLVMAQN